jgi:hypothetical protein
MPTIEQILAKIERTLESRRESAEQARKLERGELL